VPVIGDAISGLISSYIIFEARRLGAPRWLITRMAANTALDTILGSIPLLGDMFDVAYKANLKNVNLLKRHAEKHGHRYGPRHRDDVHGRVKSCHPGQRRRSALQRSRDDKKGVRAARLTRPNSKR
jgi:hypothetical protein